MTDITDQDRRTAREWAASIDPDMKCWSDRERAAARYILTAIPAPTLADEVRDLPDFAMSGDNGINDCYERADDVAFRVEQMERNLTAARAEVERLTPKEAEPEHSTYTTPEGDVYRIYETADQLPDTDESFRDRYEVLTDAKYEKENEVLGIRTHSDGPWVKVNGDENVDGWITFAHRNYPVRDL